MTRWEIGALGLNQGEMENLGRLKRVKLVEWRSQGELQVEGSLHKDGGKERGQMDG